MCEMCVPDMAVLDGFIPASKPVPTARVVEAVIPAPVRPAMRPFMVMPILAHLSAN
jgi:hypothetical protein